ncbi:2-C-methyl-D-erythritol 2,4-cyclodiphosphate synthase [Corynebacterium choanae]|uniref:2-C-methyl-D-erythritol 2,4-cyclodiphosphate synthase n=1 Tax=Corynebacterium choanae TaxID=1862358 RepID=A0A3G6J426_9CORY|nr:2-C-methyl-D-erythritol 2,4-cyclodiphosphate synthase [Corynebacterium choanae]AZA12767.1 2-C-methyl-D-erythritol 2,4-cyclodiphosphate synthase [Corynebacterium choanae]
MVQPTPAQPALPRVGTGFDAHQIEAGKPCFIGCIEIPAADGCEGHSDGDVVAHAIVDALLAAAGLGDLGSFVGVGRKEYDGVSGTRLLEECVALLAQHHYRIGNVSVQLIANTPKMAAYREQSATRMSAILHAPVNLSATTTDHMGFTGRGEGRAAIATALVFESA